MFYVYTIFLFVYLLKEFVQKILTNQLHIRGIDNTGASNFCLKNISVIPHIHLIEPKTNKMKLQTKQTRKVLLKIYTLSSPIIKK